nr:two-component regulator propeller domain-containing protein [uncultured Sphingomonas sp.]
MVLATTLALGAAGASRARAQPAAAGFEQFKHTRWTVDDGAPGSIWAIAQTPDGYLWLGTEGGLYRFDGAVFEAIPAPAGSLVERKAVYSLLVRRSGELWVGFGASGGAAAYRHGQLVSLSMPDPPVSIELAETSDGVVWASNSARNGANRRLWRYAGSRWAPVADRLKLPGGMIQKMVALTNGSLLVAVNTANDGVAIAALLPGAQTFQPAFRPLFEGGVIAPDRNGTVWGLDDGGVWPLQPIGKMTKPSFRGTPEPAHSNPQIVFDRAGGVWVATFWKGILYSPSVIGSGGAPLAQLARFGAENGLASDAASSAFVDREDNVWIGTADGLDQFRSARVRSEPGLERDSAQRMIAAAKDGAVCLSNDRVVVQIGAGRTSPPLLRGIWAICPSLDHGIWAVSWEGRVVRIDGTRISAYPPVPSGQQGAALCMEDSRQNLWVRLYSMRLLRRDQAGWHEVIDPATALARRDYWDLLTTPAGDIVFRQATDTLITLGSTGSVKTSLKRFGIYPLTMSVSGVRDVFVGGQRGLVRLRNGEGRSLSTVRFPWLGNLRSMIQTPQGETWFMSAEGLSRVRTQDLGRAFEDSRAPLPRVLLNGSDGLAGSVQGWGVAGPQAAQGRDGRIWFLTDRSTVYVDGAAMGRNALAPTVAIRTLTVAGKIYRDPSDLVLSAGTRSLDITYAGLSLSVPKRVQFRYRLEGVDDAWVDPGTRRTASYSNLGPGRYQFAVIAANDDGVWNRRGATLNFEIKPTFFESWPFRLLCGAALLGLLWLAYALRLRAVVRRTRARMLERMEEREHIARELHDTLLQSVQSLTLRFQLAVDDLPEEAPARWQLERSIDRADEVIAEGRDRLRSLRPYAPDVELPQIVAEMVARQDFPSTASTKILVSGTPRPLDPVALSETARIVGEALFNIWRHAHADRISIDIRYETALLLRIVDNGVGIAPEILERGGKAGHFGLLGMGERARKLGGDLRVEPAPQGGTIVALTIPGHIAYRQRRRGRFAALFGKGRFGALR